MPNSNISNLTVPPTTTMSAHIAASDPHPMYVLTDQLKAAVKTQISVSDLQDVIIDSDTTMNRTILIHNDGCWKPISVDDLLDDISLPVATTTKYGVAKLATYRDIAVSGSSTVVTPNLLIEYVSNALSDYQAPANYSYATTTTSGIVRLATNTDLTNRDQSAVVTPYLLRQYVDTLPRGSGTTTSVIVSAPLATHTVAGVAKLAEASDIVNSVTSMIVTPDLVASVSNNISRTISAASSTLNASITNASSALNVSITNASSALNVAKQNVLTASNAGTGISISSTTEGVKINCTVQPGSGGKTYFDGSYTSINTSNNTINCILTGDGSTIEIVNSSQIHALISGGSGNVPILSHLYAMHATNKTHAVAPMAIVGSFINATMMGFNVGAIKPFLKSIGVTCCSLPNVFCTTGMTTTTVADPTAKSNLEHVASNRHSTTGGFYVVPSTSLCSKYREMLTSSQYTYIEDYLTSGIPHSTILAWDNTAVMLPLGSETTSSINRLVIEFGRTRPIVAGDDFPHEHYLMKPFGKLLYCGLTTINYGNDYYNQPYDLAPQLMGEIYDSHTSIVAEGQSYVKGFSYMAQRMWAAGTGAPIQFAYVAIGTEVKPVNKNVSAEYYEWPGGGVLSHTSIVSDTDGLRLVTLTPEEEEAIKSSSDNGIDAKFTEVVSTMWGWQGLGVYWSAHANSTGATGATTNQITISSDTWYQCDDMWSGCGNVYKATEPGYSMGETDPSSSGVNPTTRTIKNETVILSNRPGMEQSVAAVAIGSSGILEVMSDCVADYPTVNYSGLLKISNGGTVTWPIVNSNGSVIVFTGGTVTDLLMNSYGYVYVSTGGYISNVEVNESGSLFIGNEYTNMAGGSCDSVILSGGMTVCSGGQATYVVVNQCGSLYVESGQITSVIVNSDGFVTLESVAGANCVSVNSSGYVNVSDNTSISNLTVNIGGNVWIAESATATTVIENGGYVSEENSSVVTFASNVFTGTYSSGLSATVHSGTSASDVILSSGAEMYIYSGGVLINPQIEEYAYVYIRSGGTLVISDTTNIASIHMSSGAIKISGEDTSVVTGGDYSCINGVFE